MGTEATLLPVFLLLVITPDRKDPIALLSNRRDNYAL